MDEKKLCFENGVEADVCSGRYCHSFFEAKLPRDRSAPNTIWDGEETTFLLIVFLDNYYIRNSPFCSVSFSRRQNNLVPAVIIRIAHGQPG